MAISPAATPFTEGEMNMWDTIKGLLSSKKAVMTVLGVATGLIAKLGIDLPTEDLYAVVSPFLVYLGAQGLSDAGKGKAEVNGSS